MNYFHVYVINFPSFYSAFSVLYIFIISFSISVLFSKRRISVDILDFVKSFQTNTSIYYLVFTIYIYLLAKIQKICRMISIILQGGAKILQFWNLNDAKVSKYCRSRRDLSNEYLFFSIHYTLAKIGFDTAENGPLKFVKH